MALPDFNEAGDLPPGVYRASLKEAIEHFNFGGLERRRCTQRLEHIFNLAQLTNHVQRFIIFGSYVTSKPAPNDVDIILIMADDFRMEDCPSESRGIFDHAIAQARFGASVFWVRPAHLIGETVEDFVAYWQTKRDKEKRGILEVLL